MKKLTFLVLRGPISSLTTAGCNVCFAIICNNTKNPRLFLILLYLHIHQEKKNTFTGEEQGGCKKIE